MANELVTTNSNFLMPIVNVPVALQAYQSMKDFVSAVLREGVDFGKVPGTGDKPTLLKPGAEKLTRFFGLRILLPDNLSKRVEDWTGDNHNGEPFFFYTYTAQAWSGDRLIAECEASVNSWEKKYRYRDQNRKCPKCGKEAIIKGKEEYGGGWLCYTKKGGCNSKFQEKDPAIIDQVTGQVKNPDIFDIVNTLQKMAQKRAIVGVTLLACNASEYFTQDIEDYTDGTFTETTPSPKQEPAPVQPVKKPAKVTTPSAELTPELIASVKTSEGVPYAELDLPELMGHLNSLTKAVKDNGLTPEVKAEKELKINVAQYLRKVMLEAQEAQ